MSALERQAIARCVRPGQRHIASIRSFVVANTDEEDVWRDTRSGDDAAKDGVRVSPAPHSQTQSCRVCSNEMGRGGSLFVVRIQDNGIRSTKTFETEREAYVSLVAHRIART